MAIANDNERARTLLRGYMRTADARRGELRTRLFFAILGVGVVWGLVSPFFAAIWGGATVATQLVEHRLGAAFRDPARVEPPRRAERFAILAASAAAVAVYGASVVFVWFGWAAYGPEFALMMIAGMMIHVVHTMHYERELFLAGMLPYAVICFALPLAEAALGGGRSAAALFLPMLIYIGYVVKSYRHLAASYHENEDERAAERYERRQAEEANRAKDRFLATMSHELRTPLNGVIGAAQALARTKLDTAQSELVRVLDTSGTVLLAVIDDILDFSKIEADMIRMERRPVSLAALAADVADLWRPNAERKGLRLEVDAETGSDDWFWGDPTRIRQILFNIVSNAIKFTAEGSVHVDFRVANADGARTLEICVTDEGCGVPEDARERLFEPFEQADSSTTRKYGGSGLGLPISRRIARLMDGDVALDAAYAGGARFVVRLPFDPAPAPTPEARPALAAARPGRTVRVLLAEDFPANRKIVEALLKDEPVELRCAENGAVALQALLAEAFDLVLMDVQMPVLDGVEATRRLRATEGPNRETPVVALTANALDDQRRVCIEAGMTEHLAKPIRRDALVETIYRLGRRDGDEAAA